MSDQSEYEIIMADYDRLLKEELEKQAAQRERILAEVKPMISAEAYADIEEELHAFDNQHNFAIVDAARGRLQGEQRAFGDYYVDEQLNGGHSGDDFAGCVYIPIGQDKYLKFDYEM